MACCVPRCDGGGVVYCQSRRKRGSAPICPKPRFQSLASIAGHIGKWHHQARLQCDTDRGPWPRRPCQGEEYDRHRQASEHRRRKACPQIVGVKDRAQSSSTWGERGRGAALSWLAQTVGSFVGGMDSYASMQAAEGEQASADLQAGARASVDARRRDLADALTRLQAAR